MPHAVRRHLFSCRLLGQPWLMGERGPNTASAGGFTGTSIVIMPDDWAAEVGVLFPPLDMRWKGSWGA
eukprot:12927280-Prorocentrum_lima.AAC.1